MTWDRDVAAALTVAKCSLLLALQPGDKSAPLSLYSLYSKAKLCIFIANGDIYIELKHVFVQLFNLVIITWHVLKAKYCSMNILVSKMEWLLTVPCSSPNVTSSIITRQKPVFFHRTVLRQSEQTTWKQSNIFKCCSSNPFKCFFTLNFLWIQSPACSRHSSSERKQRMRHSKKPTTTYTFT